MILPHLRMEFPTREAVRACAARKPMCHEREASIGNRYRRPAALYLYTRKDQGHISKKPNVKEGNADDKSRDHQAIEYISHKEVLLPLPMRCAGAALRHQFDQHGPVQ